MKTAAVQALRRTLAADRPAFGLWVTLDSPSVTEVAMMTSSIEGASSPGRTSTDGFERRDDSCHTDSARTRNAGGPSRTGRSVDENG